MGLWWQISRSIVANIEHNRSLSVFMLIATNLRVQRFSSKAMILIQKLKLPSRRNCGKMNTPNTHIRSLSWLGTGTSLNGGGFKFVIWAQISPLYEKNKRYMQTTPYDMGLIFMHNICNIRDERVVIKYLAIWKNRWP